VARRCHEVGGERDLIEAGLNEGAEVLGYGDSDNGALAIPVRGRFLGGCRECFGRRRLGRTGIAREPEFEVLRWRELLLRLRRLIGMAARIASACAAMLRAILAMASGAIDVMTYRNETADG
jgi:hypothetical protein